MSKKYQNKTCVYCGTPKSSFSADHVLAREFLPIGERAGLPKVPSCRRCNDKKSRLEHYATTVLPFGSHTYYAKEFLSDSVRARMDRNIKLQKELRKSSKRIWYRSASGLIVPTLSIPIKGRRINELIKYIVRGLAYYHWGIIIPSNYSLEINSTTNEGIETLRKGIFSFDKDNSIQGNIGSGCIIYHCKKSPEDPYLTAWEINF